MRVAFLGLAVTMIECASPAMEIPAPSAAELEVAPAIVGTPELAPAPRRVDVDPRRPARMESFRKDPDRVLRGLASWQIFVADPVEPLVKENPHYEVYRGNGFVLMHYDPTHYGGTSVIAKNGKLIAASSCSCIYFDTFFDSMTEEDRQSVGDMYERERKKRRVFQLSVPAVVGYPAGLGNWIRYY